MGGCVRGYPITYFIVGATGLQVTSAIPGFDVFFSVSGPLNVDLRLRYVSSSRNLADCPSRHLSRQDASFSPSLWDSVHLAYGGENDHSVDRTALPSKVRPGFGWLLTSFFAPILFPIVLAFTFRPGHY